MTTSVAVVGTGTMGIAIAEVAARAGQVVYLLDPRPAALQRGRFKMEPFELMDLIGHDVGFAVTRSVYHPIHEDARNRPLPLQKELRNAGWLSRKRRRGIFNCRTDTTALLLDTAARAATPTRFVVEGDRGVAKVLLEMLAGRVTGARMSGMRRCTAHRTEKCRAALRLQRAAVRQVRGNPPVARA